MSHRRLDTSEVGTRTAQIAIFGSLFAIPCFATLSSLDVDTSAILAIVSWMGAMFGLCVIGFSVERHGRLLGIALGGPDSVTRERLLRRAALQLAVAIGVLGCLYLTVTCFL